MGNCAMARDKDVVCYCHMCRRKIYFERMYVVVNLHEKSFLLCSRDCWEVFICG